MSDSDCPQTFLKQICGSAVTVNVVTNQIASFYLARLNPIVEPKKAVVAYTYVAHIKEKPPTPSWVEIAILHTFDKVQSTDVQEEEGGGEWALLDWNDDQSSTVCFSSWTSFSQVTPARAKQKRSKGYYTRAFAAA